MGEFPQKMVGRPIFFNRNGQGASSKCCGGGKVAKLDKCDFGLTRGGHQDMVIEASPEESFQEKGFGGHSEPREMVSGIRTLGL